MSVVSRVNSTVKQVTEPRAILGPAGNKVRVLEESKRKTEILKKTQQKPKKAMPPPSAASIIPEPAVKNNLSVESSSSSEESFSSRGWEGRSVNGSGRKVKSKVGSDKTEIVEINKNGLLKRCDWITPNSDPLYTAFHDEEWGVPVRDDQKLFELLVFSQALAELSWPAILHTRDIFRKLFDNFDPSSIAQFTEKKLLSLKVNGNLLLSEPKLRAVAENAKMVLKIQQEFGSFSNYCWRFVNHKPLRNGFRYARQVPVKTPKAELLSKDLMRRGFRCVGPTAVYSFMQVAGIVNDHLVTCYRYNECNASDNKDLKPKMEKIEMVTEALEKSSLSDGF